MKDHDADSDGSTDDEVGGFSRPSRRTFLGTAGTLATAGLAGCQVPFSDSGASNEVGLSDFRGSGALVSSRPEPEGTRISELPDLSGTLTLYLAGGEGGLYLDLLDLFTQIYPDFDYEHKLEPSADLANTIIEESKAGTSPADVFIAVDAGSLGAVANAGATQDLPQNVRDAVPSSFRTKNWAGVSGRARSVPYNTNKYSESDVPSKVADFATSDSFGTNLGWAPSYGAFQSFVTAMRLLRGDQQTKQWLQNVAERATTYPDEWRVSNAVADGELGAGFANHYYALRVKNARENTPLDITFTEGDAGALVNVSGAALVKGSQNTDLATTFIRHLHSAEAQEFFATQTFAYPMIPGVQPAGGLPTIDELNPPDIDLTELANIDETLDLMREAGVLS
jgi:iron(III) transport system substrate-binding protein